MAEIGPVANIAHTGAGIQLPETLFVYTDEALIEGGIGEDHSKRDETLILRLALKVTLHLVRLGGMAGTSTTCSCLRILAQLTFNRLTRSSLSTMADMVVPCHLQCTALSSAQQRASFSGLTSSTPTDVDIVPTVHDHIRSGSSAIDKEGAFESRDDSNYIDIDTEGNKLDSLGIHIAVTHGKSKKDEFET
ncbi:hypothetical protein SVAN01_00091 [Stagonosporopsis vannaccii]|nr:hypothetical protein SVAN01_00091 [Stagonosporopsis vannaccii]